MTPYVMTGDPSPQRPGISTEPLSNKARSLAFYEEFLPRFYFGECDLMTLNHCRTPLPTKKTFSKFEVHTAIRCRHNDALLHNLVTLIFDLLSFKCCHIQHIMWLTLPSTLYIILLSDLELYNTPPLDNIRVMVIVWKLRGNIIRQLCAGLCDTMFTVRSTHMWAVLTGSTDWVCHIGTLRCA